MIWLSLFSILCVAILVALVASIDDFNEASRHQP